MNRSPFRDGKCIPSIPSIPSISPKLQNLTPSVSQLEQQASSIACSSSFSQFADDLSLHVAQLHCPCPAQGSTSGHAHIKKRLSCFQVSVCLPSTIKSKTLPSSRPVIYHTTIGSSCTAPKSPNSQPSHHVLPCCCKRARSRRVWSLNVTNPDQGVSKSVSLPKPRRSVYLLPRGVIVGSSSSFR